MNSATAITITLTPTVAYIIVRLYTNKLIKNKITDRANRKKYTRNFNRYLSGLFAPIILSFFLVVFFLTRKFDSTLVVINFIVQCLVLASQILLASVFWGPVMHAIKDIRTLSEREILEKKRFYEDRN